MADNEVVWTQEVPGTFIAEEDVPEVAQPAARVTTLSKPHVLLETFTSDLTQSLKRVFPTVQRRYAGVCVLLVRWEDDDLNTESEIKDLDEIFQKTYNYITERGLIPSKNAYNSLEWTIAQFKRKYDSPDNLLIFYYGGHGVGGGATNPDNKSIWAANRKPTSPQLNWSKMQEMLKGCQADVLFILDCCYASTAGTREKLQGAKEVLAACSMESVTTGVHDNSFTRQFIAELKQCAKEPLTTWQLYGKLIIRKGKNLLRYTPHHFPLTDTTAPRIELRPLMVSSAQLQYGAQGNFSSLQTTPELTTSMSTLSTEADASILYNRIVLAINLKDPTVPPLSHEWVEWLSSKAPGNIESIIAMYQPDQQHQTVHAARDPRSWTQGLTTFPEPSRVDQVKEALIRTENAFDSHSTLLLVSIALPLWTYLPDNPAYTFVGFVTSRSRMRGIALSRTNTLSKIKIVAAEFDSQHGWYKWYFGLSLCVLPSFWRVLPQKNTESLLLFFALMAFVLGTPFSLLVASSVSREFDDEVFPQSNLSFKNH